MRENDDSGQDGRGRNLEKNLKRLAGLANDGLNVEWE